LRPGLVPQTVFWALDDDGEAVGIVRLRHYLNDNLRVHGGHIGYYVRRDQRGKGYGKEMLRLATTDPDNVRSIRVIEANDGQFFDVSTDPRTGAKYQRYWVDLEPQQGAAADANKLHR
jgi:predicted acetyltransferase